VTAKFTFSKLVEFVWLLYPLLCGTESASELLIASCSGVDVGKSVFEYLVERVLVHLFYSLFEEFL
jgi:hypothetical protein